MVRPLLLAEPGPGDASCTTWTLSVFCSPSLPSGGSAFQQIRNSFVSGLATFSVRFKSYDYLRAIPAFRPSSLASGLSTFSARFRSCDHLRSCCDPNLAVGGFLSNGGFKLL